MKIEMIIGDLELTGELNDSPIAMALAASLPVETSMSRWGDEYYGPVSLGMPNDPDTAEEVDVGTIAYWPTGDSLCVFFGPTPMSNGDRPRAASAVSVIGEVAGDFDALRALGSNVTVLLREG